MEGIGGALVGEIIDSRRRTKRARGNRIQSTGDGRRDRSSQQGQRNNAMNMQISRGRER